MLKDQIELTSLTLRAAHSGAEVSANGFACWGWPHILRSSEENKGRGYGGKQSSTTAWDKRYEPTTT